MSDTYQVSEEIKNERKKVIALLQRLAEIEPHDVERLVRMASEDIRRGNYGW